MAATLTFLFVLWSVGLFCLITADIHGLIGAQSVLHFPPSAALDRYAQLVALVADEEAHRRTPLTHAPKGLGYILFIVQHFIPVAEKPPVAALQQTPLCL